MEDRSLLRCYQIIQSNLFYSIGGLSVAPLKINDFFSPTYCSELCPHKYSFETKIYSCILWINNECWNHLINEMCRMFFSSSSLFLLSAYSSVTAFKFGKRKVRFMIVFRFLFIKRMLYILIANCDWNWSRLWYHYRSFSKHFNGYNKGDIKLKWKPEFYLKRRNL